MIEVTGELRANGGRGACAPNSGGCGGSGSGGVLYVTAPALEISGRLSAIAAPRAGGGGTGGSDASA